MFLLLQAVWRANVWWLLMQFRTNITWISKTEYFKYFCQMPSKSRLIISSYTVSKLVHFFWDTVYKHYRKWKFSIYTISWRQDPLFMYHSERIRISCCNTTVKRQYMYISLGRSKLTAVHVTCHWNLPPRTASAASDVTSPMITNTSSMR